MRFRLALALSVSILLIGVASWSRFGTTKYVRSNLIAVEQLGTNEIYDEEEVVKDFLEPKPETVSAPAPEKPLTDTDIISRNLILDYIGLAMNGQATEMSISALANQYAEKVPTLHKIVKVGYQDIKITSDSKANFNNYSNELGKIYNEHTVNISSVGVNGVGIQNETYNSFAGSATTIYEGTVLKLKNLSVPLALASAHLQLINSLISSATAMKSIYETEKDPLQAFAGFIAMNKSLDEEIAALKEVEKILKANAI